MSRSWMAVAVVTAPGSVVRQWPKSGRGYHPDHARARRQKRFPVMPKRPVATGG